jgi:G:T-mismatch repair DNA endonuclease (very short patch repair protein)
MNDFWKRKIERNIARDHEVNRTLRRKGWTAVRLREAAIKKDPKAAVWRIRSALAKTGNR